MKLIEKIRTELEGYKIFVDFGASLLTTVFLTFANNSGVFFDVK